MRSLTHLIMLSRAEDFTQANAEALIKEQVDEMVSVLHYEPSEARRIMLNNIGYYAAYYPDAIRDKVYQMFDTQHPKWGKTAPPPTDIDIHWIQARLYKERNK